MPTRAVVLLLVLLYLATAPALAGDSVVVPVAASPMELDGHPTEAAWSEAAVLPTGTFDGDPAPLVRALVSGNRLWISAALDERPGPGVGLTLMVAADGTQTAAEALAVAFAPQSLRAPRWVVQGPRGTGRGVYRLEGAAAITDPARWSVEVALPLADLALAEPTTVLRLAVVVRSRVASRVAWSPADAAYQGPASWTQLVAADGWPQGEYVVDVAALTEIDLKDEDRLYAWSRFGSAYRATIADLLSAAGQPFGALEKDGPKVVLDTLRDLLVEPLEEVSRLRPDLAFAHVVRAGVLHQMGQDQEARKAYEQALAIMPGLGEAQFGIHLDLVGPGLAAAPVGEPTDYAAAFAAAQASRSEHTSGFAAEGAAFGTALLHFAHGDFAEALAALEPLAARYPFQQSVVAATTRARLAVRRWQFEARYREVEAKRNDLPRVRLATTRGDLVLELFEDDAPNTVKNFIWLATHGFYDGTPVARTVPFLLAEVGAGDPGWAVATQQPPGRQQPGSQDARRRLPWRGSVVMLSPAPDAAGARFALLTGTAPRLESDLIPFGRVVEGLDVLDALTPADRIEKASVVRSRPGTEYRPLTVEGTPAPTPR